MKYQFLGRADRTFRVRKGSYLFRRGDPAWAVYVVKSGRIRLERPLVDGTAMTLAVLRRGDGIAEAALFSDRYHCDARAEVETSLRLYPKAQVLPRLDKDNQAMRQLVSHLSGQVRRLRAILEIRSIKRADERTLAYLALLDSLDEEWDQERPLSAIAAELGLAPETLYRTLSKLERSKRIVRRGRCVNRVIDLPIVEKH